MLEEEISLGDCAEIVLGIGIDSMLEAMVGPLESTILIRLFHQLGARYPVQVYRYIAEMWKQGAAVEEQQEMREQLGFRLHQGGGEAKAR